jgi:hypothetical protein
MQGRSRLWPRVKIKFTRYAPSSGDDSHGRYLLHVFLQEDGQLGRSKPLNLLSVISTPMSSPRRFLKKNLLAEVQSPSDVGAD